MQVMYNKTHNFWIDEQTHWEYCKYSNGRTYVRVWYFSKDSNLLANVAKELEASEYLKQVNNHLTQVEYYHKADIEYWGDNGKVVKKIFLKLTKEF